LPFRAGVVDGDVEPAESGDGLIDEAADFRFMADIGLDESRFGTEAPQLRFESFPLRIPTAGDDNPGAFRSEGAVVRA